MIDKRQMPLHYFETGAENSRPVFSYLLTTENPANGRFRIEVVNMTDIADPAALWSRTITMVTDDPSEAFLGAVAQINSHHDGLKPSFDLTEIDKDRERTPAE